MTKAQKEKIDCDIQIVIGKLESLRSTLEAVASSSAIFDIEHALNYVERARREHAAEEPSICVA